MTTKFIDAPTSKRGKNNCDNSRADGALPLRPSPWEKLSPEIREAMFHDLFAGHLDGIRQADSRRRP